MRSLLVPCLALQFFAELAVLAVLGYWGYQATDSGVARVALAIAAPAFAALVWGVFGSPRAPRHLTGAARVLLEVVFFGSAAAALAATGRIALAVAFAVVVGANIAVLKALGRDE